MLVAFVLAGCAQAPKPPDPPKQILTQDEQQFVAERCAQGCVIIPKAQWQEVLKLLKERGL